MALQVPAQRAVGERRALARRIGVPLADGGLVVQQVDRAFDEHRPRHAELRPGQRLSTAGPRSRTRVTLIKSLTCGATSGRWSMSCSAPRPCSAVGAAPPISSSGRLRELRVLERGDGVGDAGPGGDRGHAGDAGQPRRGVGGEDGGDLVAGVDDADAARLGRRQDGRDVPAAQREDHARRGP
jgi:hypothetical protein